jgi:N-acetylneuraminic acid mutarotase
MMIKQSVLAAAALMVFGAATPLKGGWNIGPPLPVARSEVAVATVSDAVYVIGGYANGDVDQSLVEVFRPAVRDGVLSGAWHDAAPLPRGLNHVGAAGYRGKLYTFGGFAAQNNSAVSDANVYDPKTNRWSPIAPLPQALGSVAVTVLGDEIHLVGGRAIHSVSTHLVYDPIKDRYVERAPLPVGRDHMGLVAFDGRIYAIGGRIDTPAHNTAYVDVYDPKLDRWTSAAPLPQARSGFAAAAFIQRIFVVGGEQAGMPAAFANGYIYDPHRNCWSPGNDLPEGRHGTGAAVVDDRLYIPAGAPVPGGSRQSKTLFVYQPMIISYEPRRPTISR